MIKRQLALRRICICALFAAVFCIISPIAVPIGVVPVSFSLSVVLLCAGIMGAMGSFMTALVYLALGAIGLPVFAGGMGGFGVLVGPTGGYIWSYLMICIVCGLLYRWLYRRIDAPAGRSFWGWGGAIGALALLICYTLGTLQYMWVTETSFGAAVAVCVVPFVAIDVIKVLAATLLIGHFMRISYIRRLIGACFGI